MEIRGLSPLLNQTLVAGLPKLAQAFGVNAGEADARLPAPAPSSASPATSVQMLVTLAAAEPETERRRRQAAETDRGLSMLEALQAELLLGTPAPERLEALAEWAETFQLPEQPELAAIAREIELRVRVELAKIDRRV